MDAALLPQYRILSESDAETHSSMLFHLVAHTAKAWLDRSYLWVTGEESLITWGISGCLMLNWGGRGRTSGTACPSHWSRSMVSLWPWHSHIDPWQSSLALSIPSISQPLSLQTFHSLKVDSSAANNKNADWLLCVLGFVLASIPLHDFIASVTYVGDMTKCPV